MKSLIFGLDLGGSTPAQVSGHERTVKEAFLAVAPEGWTADIIISTSRPELFIGYAPVHATVSSTGVFDFATNLVPYVQANDIYDIIVYSYSSSGGRITESNLDAILSTTNVQAVFSSMGNSGSQQKYASDIWWMGGGVTENIRQGGYKCFGWEDGVAGAGFTTDTFTSETASTSAGHFASFVDLGLPKAQTRKAFIQAFPNQTKDIQNGFGLVPTSASIPQTYNVLPPWSLWAYTANEYRENGVIRGYSMYLFWCPVLGQSETVRIYRNDELIYEGTGADSSTSRAYFGTSRGKQWQYLLDENGTSVFTITHVDGTESSTALYATDSVTVQGIVSPTPPEPPPPAPEPEDEEELTPFSPNPILFLTRSGTTNTLSTDGGGSVQVFQRRNSVDAEWTTVTESDTQPASQTFMYRVQVSDGVTLSAYSDIVYSRSTEVSPLKLAIL